MYLINVQSMELEYFQDDRKLVYAILSHRWRDEEVLFDDMRNGTAQSKAGWHKLKHFCDEAAAAKYSYAWCDTCCIDKASSAELSEAINSMFRWYQNAAVTYAYLFDVTTTHADDASDFKESAWFTRGWCLQELLAPKDLTFFNRDWIDIGSKVQLNQVISDITGIPKDALTGRKIGEFSIAQRMSWAADRDTTRVEDMAYSLLGLFGVNMPLLYGEGGRAFLRLQEEIMRKSSDQSIFVHSSTDNVQGLLATSPADFRDSFDVEPSPMLTGEPYSFTNMGLSIELLLFPWAMEVYLAHLDCKKPDSDAPISIFLMLQPQVVQRDGTNATDHAVRIKLNGKAWVHDASVSHLPPIQKRLYLEYETPEEIEPQRYGFWVRNLEGVDSWRKDSLLWACTWHEVDNEKCILEIPQGEFGTVGIMVVRTKHGAFPLRLGFTVDFEPVIEIYGDPNYPDVVDGRVVSVLGANDFSFGPRHGSDSNPPDPSIKQLILRSVDWTAGAYRRNVGFGGLFVRAQHRDRPVTYGPRGYAQGTFEFICQKLVVDGVRTWVLDITARYSAEEVFRLVT